jgi:uncharacterized membrane protein
LTVGGLCVTLSDMARSYNLLPKHRLEAFSDGVLAIAITLLVLELKVPTEGHGLGRALLEEWRVYLAYVVSFSFVGGWWVSHSNLTRFIRAGTGAAFRLNLLALFFVSVIPFTTSLMGEHTRDEGARVATIVFGVDLLLASLLLNLLARYLAGEKDLVDDEVARADLRAFVRGRWWGVGLLVLSIAVAAVEPRVAVGFYVASSALFIFEPLIPRGQRGSAASGESGEDDDLDRGDGQ